MKKVMAVLLAAAMVASMAACGSSSSSSTSSSAASTASSASGSSAASAASGTVTSAKDTVVVQIGSDPGDLSPYGVFATDVNRVKQRQIYESLMRQEYDNTLNCCLCKSYEWVDSTHIRFVLRDDVTFSNGQKMTAEDVYYSMSRGVNDAVYQKYAESIDIDNTVIENDYSILVALNKEDAFFLYTTGTLPICCKAYEEADSTASKTKPVGTGPYVLSSWTSGDRVELVARDDYWGEKPLIKNLTFRVISESAQRLVALEMGEVDFVWDVATDSIASYKDDPAYTLLTHTGNSTLGFMFNCSSASVLNNKKLREAICYAVDSTSVTQVVYGDYGTPAFSYATSIFTGVTGGESRYDDGPLFTQDLDKAKSLIAESGVSNPSLTIITTGDSKRTSACEVVSGMLTKAGFTCSIKSYESAVFNQLINQAEGGEWDMYVGTYACPSCNVLDIYNSQFGADGVDRTKLGNEELHTLIAEGITTTDEKRATEISDRIVEIMFEEEFPCLPLVQVTNTWLYNSNLKSINTADGKLAVYGPSGMWYPDWYFEK